MDKQVDFLRDIPQPDFSVLSKKKLSVICDNLEVVECTRGMVVFNQDEPIKNLYIVKNGLFVT